MASTAAELVVVKMRRNCVWLLGVIEMREKKRT